MHDLEYYVQEVYDNLDEHEFWVTGLTNLEYHTYDEELLSLLDEDKYNLIRLVNERIKEGRKSEYSNLMNKFKDILEEFIDYDINDIMPEVKWLPNNYIGQVLVELGSEYFNKDE